MKDIDEFSLGLTEQSKYQINHSDIHSTIFNLINIFYSHIKLLGTVEASLVDFWHQQIRLEISRNLIKLAIELRILLETNGEKYSASDQDDIFMYCKPGPEPKTNKVPRHMEKTLHNACNKIIHAHHISFNLAKIDRHIPTDDNDEECELSEATLCLDYEVVLRGIYRNKDWLVTLYIPSLAYHALQLLQSIGSK